MYRDCYDKPPHGHLNTFHISLLGCLLVRHFSNLLNIYDSRCP